MLEIFFIVKDDDELFFVTYNNFLKYTDMSELEIIINICHSNCGESFINNLEYIKKLRNDTKITEFSNHFVSNRYNLFINPGLLLKIDVDEFINL